MYMCCEYSSKKKRKYNVLVYVTWPGLQYDAVAIGITSVVIKSICQNNSTSFYTDLKTIFALLSIHINVSLYLCPWSKYIVVLMSKKFDNLIGGCWKHYTHNAGISSIPAS